VSDAHSLTNFLNQGGVGGGPGDRLAARIVEELRKIAGADAERNPTAWRGVDLDEAVAEVYLRLVIRPTGGSGPADAEATGPWNDRKHFYRTAARAIRFLRIDHARRRKSLHLDSRAALEDSGQGEPPDDLARAEQLLRLDEALTGLATADADAAEAIQLYYFGVRLPAAGSATAARDPGQPPARLTYEQIGELVGKSKASVCLAIQRGRAWLSARLGGTGEGVS
jgi:RNA polymerase sigma factor (sigma-70 family)